MHVSYVRRGLSVEELAVYMFDEESSPVNALTDVSKGE